METTVPTETRLERTHLGPGRLCRLPRSRVLHPNNGYRVGGDLISAVTSFAINHAETTEDELDTVLTS